MPSINPSLPLPGIPQAFALDATRGTTPAPSTVAPDAVGFREALLDSLAEYQKISSQARTNVERGLVGEELPMVETFTSIREADLALRMMIQVRNKLVAAFNEIKQMQL